MIDIRNNINCIKTKKMETYGQFFADGTETAADYQVPSKNTPNDDDSRKTTLYVGCDPGLKIMVEATYANSKKVAFFLSQTNRYGPLEDLVEPLQDDEVKPLLKLKTFPMSSRDIENKTMTYKHQKQLILKNVK